MVTDSTGCHITPGITSLCVLEKEIMSIFCPWCIPGKFFYFFPLVQSLSLSFFFSCLQQILILLFLLLLSFYIFLFFFLSFLQTCIFRVTDDVTAKYVLQKLQLICHHCILFLFSCRLLLLQVMPLSHLHPSHSLLVQTCLVLYRSVLLPYPQVRNLLEIKAQLKFGDWFSALVCISVLKPLI